MTLKESDAQRIGWAEAMESGSSLMFIFLFLEHIAEEKGDIRGREWTGVANDRRMGGRLRCPYIIPAFKIS